MSLAAWSSLFLHALVQKVDVFATANVLEPVGPHANAYLAKMGLLQQQHQCARLPDSSANAERDLVVDQCLMVGELQELSSSS